MGLHAMGFLLSTFFPLRTGSLTSAVRKYVDQALANQKRCSMAVNIDVFIQGCSAEVRSPT